MNILVIHEIVPHHDCSGADLRIFQLIRELRGLGHGVTLVARLDRNADKYGPVLEALGASVFAGDAERLHYLGFDTRSKWSLPEILKESQFDAAILCHWYWNGISIPEHYLDEIRRWSPQTCVMVLSEDRHGERERRSFQLTGLLTDWERAENFEQREAEVYRRADLVLYVSEIDHRHFQKLVPRLRAEHLPTIAEAGEEGLPLEQREGVLFLGNFENLANRDALDWLTAKVFPRVWKQEPRLALYLAGNALTPELFPPRKNVVLLGKVGDLGPVFAPRRVFVGPVRYGTGIITKNMIALAHGIPVVTTTVGAEGLGLRHQEHALIADAPEDFANAIVRLHRDNALWSSLSASGRRHIRDNFNLDNLRSQLRNILAQSAALPRGGCERNHCWAYREVEEAVPEVLTQRPAFQRAMLRALGYWQLGKRRMNTGRTVEALQQFRHIFSTLRGEIPPTVLHGQLLQDMAACYEAQGEQDSATRCRVEADKCARKALPRDSATARKNKLDGRKTAAERPELSVIVPTFNRRETLQLCLAALSLQTLPAELWEVIVVDDGSNDGTEAFCHDAVFPFASLRYLRQENRGAGAARRAGVAAARGDLLLFLNDDSIVAPNLLAEHRAIHRRHRLKRWSVLGAFVATPECNRHVLSLWIQHSTFLFPQNALSPGQVCAAQYFITCNLSVPRRAVVDAGSFDASLRVGEDTELGARLAARGYQVKYHPQAAAWHEHAVFTTRDLIRRAQYYGPASLALYRKHPELLGDGCGPFGKLEGADFQRMETYVLKKRAAVESAITALEALDEIDLATLHETKRLDDSRLQDWLGKVAQLAPLVYWHAVYESLLKALAEESVSAGEAGAEVFAEAGRQ